MIGIEEMDRLLLILMCFLVFGETETRKFNRCGADADCRCTDDYRKITCAGLNLERFPRFRDGVKVRMERLNLQKNSLRRINVEDIAGLTALRLLDITDQDKLDCVQVSCFSFFSSSSSC